MHRGAILRMSLIIGLTGSIATGKSTVLSYFKSKGVPVIDADDIAREIVEPNQPALKQVELTFGSDLIKADGTLDRAKLGELIFNEPTQRKRLNDIMHPAIVKRMIELRDELVSRHEPIIILDVPLLFEGDLAYLVDRIVVAYTNETLQLKRLMKRDQLTKKAALKRIQSQISIEEKKRWADDVIDNNGTLESTIKQCDVLFHDYKRIESQVNA